MSEHLTIRDIANKLGIGKSTVQRALKGIGNVSSRTRQQVIEAAQELGYHPDILFSILGSQNRRSRETQLKVGYVSRFHGRSPQSNGLPGINSFMETKTYGESLGYVVDYIDPDEFGSGKRLMDVLYFRGYFGVIIGQVRTPDHEAILLNKHLPVVCSGRIDSLPLHTVQPDIVQTVRLAWKQMLKAGYRRIGAALTVHSPPVEDDSDRLGAVLQCQEETLLKSERIPPLRSPMGDAKSLVQWFDNHKPEAVLAFNVGQYYFLKDAGVPMSKIGFASLHVNQDQPEFSGTIEPQETIVREVLNLLDQLIRHRSTGVPKEPLHLLIPGRWHEGESLLPKS